MEKPRHCGPDPQPPELSEDRRGLRVVARNDEFAEPQLLRTKRNVRKAMRRHVRRQILRSPIKALLTIVIAILLLFAISWLRGAIERGNEEIERLYDTTVVRAEVRRWLHDGTDAHRLNIAIYRNVVDDIMDSGFIQHAYLVAGLGHLHIVAPNRYGGFPYEVWEDEGALDNHNLHGLFAPSDIDIFTNAEQIEIIYTDGFDESIFDADTEYDFSAAIPVIMSEQRMHERGLSLGDKAFISFNFGNVEAYWTLPAQVVGMHTGSIIRGWELIEGGVSITPLASMDIIRSLMTPRYEHLASYITAQFEIDPARNHEIEEFRELLEVVVSRPRASWTHLTYEIFDSELEFVVRQMEQNLRTLYLLYPVAIVVSLLIAAGLSVLLQFQNAKNAAVMRVLGAPKRRTRAMLVAEQAIVTLIGLVLGFLALVFISMDAWLALFAAAYLGAALAGALAGSVFVSKKPPLELLQVRE